MDMGGERDEFLSMWGPLGVRRVIFEGLGFFRGDVLGGHLIFLSESLVITGVIWGVLLELGGPVDRSRD